MIRLANPEYTTVELLDVCIHSIEIKDLKARLESAVEELDGLALDYADRASIGELFTFPALPKAIGSDPNGTDLSVSI